jgi:hypothetical protein
MLYEVMELIDFFTKDLKPPQKQYEALRALAFSEGNMEEVAGRFGYTPQSLRTLAHRIKTGKQQLFPDIKPGPRGRRISYEIIQFIVKFRRHRRLSSRDIATKLKSSGFQVSVRTVERVLADAGFPKLRKRTNLERGISKKGELISERSTTLDFEKLKPFRAECQVAGVFLFLSYILESGILNIVSKCDLPESSDISKTQAALSMLLLKFIGNERLSHVGQYNTDRGFGLFAGLNVLPKPTYMCSYSCRTQASELIEFQRKTVESFCRLCPELYQGKTINLDFHSIPHFGDESEMEKVWCGMRGKAMKGANTFFAQDGESNAVIYSRADIKRSEGSAEIKNFVDYWIKVKGVINEILVFDSKLTRYDVLYDLDRDKVKFITLRVKGKSLIDKAMRIEDRKWEKVYLPIPKRKHKHVKVYENRIRLIKGKKELRQLIVKDHGRVEPTFVITNDEEMKSLDILTIYARRWHIENKLAELVGFFNLNSLSSPIMIRICFDILWTIIADTFYHLFARDLRGFEKCHAKKIFRKFVDMPGTVHYDGKSFSVRIRKRATTPILLRVEKLNKEIKVPWLDNRPLKIFWTP